MVRKTSSQSSRDLQPSMRRFKHMLESITRETNDHSRKQSTSYISPSDSILSPASQKLSSFKQKQITKQ